MPPISDLAKWLFATLFQCGLLTLPTLIAQEAPPIAEYRQRLDALEQPVQQLAEQVRSTEANLGKDHAESAKLRAELRALVQKTFAARQEIQRAELAEFTRRLQRLQKAIETREKIAEKIVDRRIEELLDPDASWEQNLQSSRQRNEETSVSDGLPEKFHGEWIVEQLVVKSSDVDLSVLRNPSVNISARHFVIPFDGNIRETLAYTLLPGTPTKVDLILEPGSSRTPALGIVEITDDTFRLCFREPADVHEPALVESDRPRTFGPESKMYFVQCRRIATPSMPLAIDPNSELFQKLQGLWPISKATTGLTEDPSDSRQTLLPTIDAILEDIDELQSRTPLKALVQFKDEPLLEMTDDTHKSFKDLRERVESNQPPESVRESFAASAESSETLISNFSRFRNQGMLDVLRDIEDGVSALMPLIEIYQRAGAITPIGVERAAPPHQTSPRVSESAAVADQTSPPESDAEKAITRMVLVFFQDEARRAVPGLMIDHGNETLVLTTGPATIVPDGVGHAIDRTFLEIPRESDVAVEFINTKTADVRVHRAKPGLTKFQVAEPVDLAVGDSLSAIVLSGQPNLRVTPNAARISALDQATTFSLATHRFRHEFSGLVQVDRRLPEGTPLFKNGELAGITLLGTRFMKDDVPGSYVVPASRIVDVLEALKTE